MSTTKAVSCKCSPSSTFHTERADFALPLFPVRNGSFDTFRSVDNMLLYRGQAHFQIIQNVLQVLNPN